MSMNNEVCPNFVERMLLPVLDIIFGNLCSKDLLNAARMCKSWHYAVSREKNRRYYIQRFRLPYQMRNLDSKLFVIPSVSLLCYTWSLEESLSLPYNIVLRDNSFFLNLLQDFQTQLPNETIIMRSDVIIDSKLTENCDIYGIFFPSARGRVRIDRAILNSRVTDQNIAEQLGLNDCPYSKSTILLFHTSIANDINDLCRICRTELEQERKEVITFANVYSNFISTSHNQSLLPLGVDVALRISGEKVDSWNTYIYLTATHDEIERKLQKLKEQVRPKRFNIGLIYSPTCRKADCTHDAHPTGDCHGMMNKLKRFFPNIRFTGFFKYWDSYDRPHVKDADKFDENDVFQSESLGVVYVYVSIIIISYD